MKLRESGYWARIALLFLVRSGRITAALSIMVVTAVAALIFLSALAVGVEDAMLRNTVGLFSGHITGYDLPDRISTEDLRLQGVQAVLKRRYLLGVISGQGIAQPVTFCGIVPEQETAVTALEKTISQGRYPAVGEREILISRDLADIFDVQTGDALRFSVQPRGPSKTFVVSGIYQTGLPALDRGVAFRPLDVIPAKDAAWSAAVFLETGVAPGSVLTLYRTRFGDPARFESWKSQMPDLRQIIDLEALSMVIVIVLVFGVVAIGVACSFVIFKGGS